MKTNKILSMLLIFCLLLGSSIVLSDSAIFGFAGYAEEEEEIEEIDEPGEPDILPEDIYESETDDMSMYDKLEETIDEAEGTIEYVISLDEANKTKETVLEAERIVSEARKTLLNGEESEYQNEINKLMSILSKLDEIFMLKTQETNKQVFKIMVNDDDDLRIGIPYVREMGQGFPRLLVQTYEKGKMKYDVIYHETLEKSQIVYSSEVTEPPLYMNQEIVVPMKIPKQGTYEILFKFVVEGTYPYYDSIYFYAEESIYSRPAGSARSAFLNDEGVMQYAPDYKGNRLMDYSTVGYERGQEEIPYVKTKIVVEPSYSGDDSAAIQNAIDTVAKMPPDENGFRGAVLLKRGVYQVSHQIKIEDSGIVLRGEYCVDENGEQTEKATIRTTYSTQDDCIQVVGSSSVSIDEKSKTRILHQYLPFGSNKFYVENTSGFSVGDDIVVRVSFTSKWVRATGHDRLVRDGVSQAWAPFVINFERTITDATKDMIQIDVPLPTNIDSDLQVGEILRCTDKRIEKVGIENLQFVCGTDILSGSKDSKMETDGYFISEERAAAAVFFNNIKHAWARDLDIRYFDKGVYFGRGAKFCTGKDMTYKVSSGIITGGRRYPFYMEGQQILFTNCRAQDARHAYALGARVPGPNVFHECSSENNYGLSEPHHRWSLGGLYDNVKANLGFYNRGTMGTGHGWAAAWYVAWNTEDEITIQTPPTAQNYSIGHVGTKGRLYYTTDMPQYYESWGSHVFPKSLYEYQLSERIGTEECERILARMKYPVDSLEK